MAGTPSSCNSGDEMAGRNPSDSSSAIIPNPDPSVITSEAIDRRTANLAAILNAKIEGMEKAVQVFQSDLTTVPTQLDRAVQGLRDLIEAKLAEAKSDREFLRELQVKRADADMAIIGTRLAGMDKAIELLQKTTDQVSDFVRDQVGQLRDLHGERFSSIDTGLIERDKRTAQSFSSIDTQFQERDKRTEQLSLADKTAIAAALQAQKEAAGATNDSNSVALAKMENNFTTLIAQGQTQVQTVSRNLEDKINDLKSRLDRGEGKTSVSDPEVTSKLNMLMAQMASVGTSRDEHKGGDAVASVTSARMMSTVAIAIAAAVGIGEIIVRLAAH